MTPEENLIIQTAKVSDTVLSATQSLVQYLEGHTSKTEVVNQLESISTPDVRYVVEALQVLDATLKTHENTDLTEITGVMRELLLEAKQVPKNHPEDKTIDYTQQLSGLTDAIQAVEKVVKAQKLIAEAPVVNVPEPNVHVDAPDLKPLQNGFKDVVAAVQKIVIPEFKTDNAAVEKLLKDANKLLQKLLEKPVGGGGGGASRASPYSDSNSMPAFPVLVDGAIPIYNHGGLISVPYNQITFTNADGNGNYQTGTVKKTGVTVGTLSLTYDGSNNVTDVQFN